MSLPKRLYDLYRDITSTSLVRKGEVTAENMTAFENLINQSNPVDDQEVAQRALVRGMYYGNPAGFLTYISISQHRARALILWTESKRIARFFNLGEKIYISWSNDTNSYTVAKFIPREERDPVNTPARNNMQYKYPPRGTDQRYNYSAPRYGQPQRGYYGDRVGQRYTNDHDCTNPEQNTRRARSPKKTSRHKSVNSAEVRGTTYKPLNSGKQEQTATPGLDKKSKSNTKQTTKEVKDDSTDTSTTTDKEVETDTTDTSITNKEAVKSDASYAGAANGKKQSWAEMSDE